MTRQVILDTETTGLNPGAGDRIIEVAGVELLKRRPSGRHFQRYVNPLRSSHPDALRVHGLTDEFLSGMPLFEQVVDDLLEFVQGAEVVIHNAAFDVAFLDAELERLGRGPFESHCAGITDSLAIAREQFPGKFNSLDALCKRFGVDNTRRTLHGALLDAELLAEVYVWLTRGQDSLVMELEDSQQAGAEQAADLSGLQLRVLAASEAELREHEAILQALDKGGKAVWKPTAAST
ncbi:MAG: DNA polymerase III subunit epsilon [Betaproteobacteria bacterium]|nr:DNA polymerase III subunit epsilon [Betaproteobacteria bacterium]MDE1955328.1 DNA polymerase III subunit epsilon [Betaproteobacteria bacterium]MDE2153004.1 DNA polymerase III subunit epsilon [Betaproteobacteria bacterium]